MNLFQTSILGIFSELLHRNDHDVIHDLPKDLTWDRTQGYLSVYKAPLGSKTPFKCQVGGPGGTGRKGGLHPHRNVVMLLSAVHDVPMANLQIARQWHPSLHARGGDTCVVVLGYFLLSSLLGEDSHFDSYFSEGLVQPTIYIYIYVFFFGRGRNDMIDQTLV